MAICLKEADAQTRYQPQPFSSSTQISPLPKNQVAVPVNRLRNNNSASSTEQFAARWKSVSSVISVSPNKASTEQPSPSVPANIFDDPNPTPMQERSSASVVKPSLPRATIQTNHLDKPTHHTVFQTASYDAIETVPAIVKTKVGSERKEVSLVGHWSDRLAHQTTSPHALPSHVVQASNQERGFEAIPSSEEELPEPKMSNQLTRPESILEDRGATKPDFPMPRSEELRSTDPPSSAEGRSPSDYGVSPSRLDKDDDPNFPDSDDLDRRRGKAKKPNAIQCDDVRQRAAAANIQSIDLDVAPNFGVTSKDKLSPEEKRRDFAMKAPIRSWYDQNGSRIAEGKLVDFNQNWLVIETPTGSQQRINLRTLSDADAAYAFDAWNIPVTCAMSVQPIQPRIYEATTTTWKASGLCHKPLYFEEIQLERSGHEHGPILQPAISTVHFFKNIAFLPYKMGIHPMNECQYALGHYRPGNCAPWSIEPVPLSLRGLASQAKVVTGTVLAFP